MRRRIIALLLLACPAAAMAQEVGTGTGPKIEVDPELPFATRRAIETALDAAGAVVETGRTTVSPTDTIAGSLVQVGGSLLLEGTVEGQVVAIDAEVTIRPPATIADRLTVFSGALYGTTLASIGGSTVWHRDAPLRLIESPRTIRIEYVPPLEGPPFPVGLEGIFGLVPREYNRVDGLAFDIRIGLRSRVAWPRTVLWGGPVFRTARLEEVGWQVAGLREFPSLGGVTAGGGIYSITDTRQRWHRSDIGNSVAALLFANDFRAYHEREGYSLFVERTFGPPWGSAAEMVRVRAGWRDDSFEPLPSEEPFALFADDEDWPRNPAAESGDGRAVELGLAWDRRDHPAFTRRGTYVDARYERWGFGGDFEFDWGQIEARGWLPFGEESFVSLRAMAGGRLGGGDTLAPQFLYRLGGIGTVAGYDALDPLLTGDRMALANLRLHLALPTPGELFRQIWLVGLTDVGDAWLDDSAPWQVGLGGGLAGRGRRAYLSVLAAYGLTSEEWHAYFLVSPSF